MCNDTEASLEADWEGYKSIWLSLNSPLWLCLSDSKVKNRTAIVYLEASICNVIASAFPSFNRIV
nr:MAG TPA: hypothetical protein [Bacteriophage sp.]